MKKTYSTADTDLDVHNLLAGLKPENVVFYFRAGAEDSDDFLYFKGDLDVGADTLANLMTQNVELEYLLINAVNTFAE